MSARFHPYLCGRNAAEWLIDMKEKILIIEDDPLIRNELKTLLQSNGYEAAAPEDFSDVIDRIKAEQPHLILLDIKLPGTNGFSLCTEVRTFSEVPIIFVTSCNTDMDELNSIMLGGDAFITKPYNTAILLAKIASLLKKAYPAQQREQIVYWQSFWSTSSQENVSQRKI